MSFTFAWLSTNKDFWKNRQDYVSEATPADHPYPDFASARRAAEEHFRKTFAVTPNFSCHEYWSDDRKTAVIEILDGRGPNAAVAFYKIFSS